MRAKLSPLGRGMLAIGSAVLAFTNPHRADMVAVLGEVTGSAALSRLRSRVERDPVGRDPVGREMVSSCTPERFLVEGASSLDIFRVMEDGALGREYARFMDRRGFSPESRVKVRFVEDKHDAWVLQRYRDVHDLWHVLTGMPITLLGEIAQKGFEAVHTGLPVAAMSTAVAPFRLSKEKRQLLMQEIFPWVFDTGRSAKDLMTIRCEDYLEVNLDVLRSKLNISLPVLSKPEILYGKRRKKSGKS